MLIRTQLSAPINRLAGRRGYDAQVGERGVKLSGASARESPPRAMRGARELAKRLGFRGEPTPGELDELATHVRAVVDFEGDLILHDLFGKAWAGLSTPIDAILGGLRMRDLACERLVTMAGGQAVLQRLLTMGEDDYASAAARMPECKRLLSLPAEERAGLSDEPATEVIAWARGRAQALAGFLAVDPARSLEGIDATFRQAAAAHRAMAEASALEASLAPGQSHFRIVRGAW